MYKPKTLLLDYSKWRSGLTTVNATGIGPTDLLNDSGYMCCLGQWCKQLGAKDRSLRLVGSREGLQNNIPLFNCSGSHGRKVNTQLSFDCMAINDDGTTTPETKIHQLKERLALHNIDLVVINRP